MEAFKKAFEKSNTSWPYTSGLRNYLATNNVFQVKTTEWNKGNDIYNYTMSLWQRQEGKQHPVRMFRVEQEGTKLKTLEYVSQKVYEFIKCFLEKNFKTQGLDADLQIVQEENAEVDSKEENVIIVGNEKNVTSGNDPIVNPLLGWSNTEKYYDFANGDSGVMSRWFALDSITVDNTYSPSINGGLIKTWAIPEAFMLNDFDSINILPMRGFLKGNFEIEFKLIVQANSFQQCCLMLSVSPYMYGLQPEFRVMHSLISPKSDTSLRPCYGLTYFNYAYSDLQCAVQRPNVILDVSAGGEATLRMTQKYHKTLIRNFDFKQISSVNPGIRGSNFGNLFLHCLSQLKYGTGSTNFNARVFYRFIKADLTAMVPVINSNPGVLRHMVPIKADKYEKAIKELTTINALTDRKAFSDQKKKWRARWTVQGGVLGVLGAVKTATDLTSDIISVVETSGQVKRKGFKPRNRDKPIDVVSQVRVVPRPRTNFTNGAGVDDAVVMAISWDEITNFFYNFTDEPTSFRDFTRIVGYMDTFNWKVSDKPSTELFSWNVHPTLSPKGRFGMAENGSLRTPMSIASSAFTNYWGTIELMFQFIKTNSHRGAVEVAIYFGGTTSDSGLKSTYVKILNLQENPAFTVTIPYIYDTPVRSLSNTSIPLYIPNLTDPTVYSFYHTARIQVRVLNELSAVSVVAQDIDCIVWARGGNDYGLNFPHAMNTLAVPGNFLTNINLNPKDTRNTYSSPNAQHQYYWDTYKGVIGEYSNSETFVTQGLGDEDFNQGAFDNNRVTNCSHLDFKTLLKMPVKILNSFQYTPTKTYTITAIRNKNPTTKAFRQYFSLPVCPLSTSLVNYLNSQYFNANREGSSTEANQILGNFESWKSIQAQILTMFAFYRGTMVYTILVKSATSPVYYCYAPHDYKLNPLIDTLPQQNMGMYSPGGDGDNTGNVGPVILGMGGDEHIDIAMTGLINGFIALDINSSEKIAIPMSNPNNFVLLNRQQAAIGNTTHPLKTMRENSEWFNGHLILWSDSDFTFDVYLNCGDDMELGGFLGHPGVSNLFAQYSMQDNWRVQGLGDLDFKLRELTSKGWNSFKNSGIQIGIGILGSALTTQLPPQIAMVTGAISLYGAMGGIHQLISLKDMIGRQISAEQVSVVSELTSIGTDAIMNILTEVFPFLRNRVKSLGMSLWNISQQIIHAILAKNWKNTAFASFCVLVELKMLEFSDWTKLKDIMEKCVQTIMPGTFQTQGLGNSEEKHWLEDAWMPLMEILVSIMGIKFQIGAIGGIHHYLRDIFKYQNYRNVSGLNSILQFTRSLFKAVCLIFKTCIKMKDPNITLLEKIQGKDEMMGNFVDEAHQFLNIFCESDFKKKEKRVQYLHTILRAYKLRVLLIKIANPKLTAQLLQLCDKVIDKASKMKYLMKCDIVIPEPFVVCIEGDSNIGKSFSVYDIVANLIKESGIKFYNPDLIFTIPAGVDYWNGYLDQPALWYDDWCNIQDEQTMRQHLSQLYALKTSAPFNVPRAELDNKDQIASPMIVIMTTNNPFPTSNVMAYPKAVYRRRDVLVKFAIKEGREISSFSESELKDFAHLDVKFYTDVTDPKSMQTLNFNYADFITELKLRFNKFRLKEATNQKNKYASLLKAVQNSPIDEVDFDNPFIGIEKFMYENPHEVSQELLDKEVEHLLFLIKNQVTLSSSQTSDDEIFETQGFIGEIGKLVVNMKDKFVDKLIEWRQAYNRKAITCANCGCFAAVHGTVLWCCDHTGYVCFHCAMNLGFKYMNDLEEKIQPGSEQHEQWKNLPYRPMCPHGNVENGCCNMVVTNRGVFNALFAEILYNTIDTPIKLYDFLKYKSGHGDFTVKALYGMVMLGKFFILGYSSYVIKLMGNYFGNNAMKNYDNLYKYSTQGLPAVKKILMTKTTIKKMMEYTKTSKYLEDMKDSDDLVWVCLDQCNSNLCHNRILHDVARRLLDEWDQPEDEQLEQCKVFLHIDENDEPEFKFEKVSLQAYKGKIKGNDYGLLFNEEMVTGTSSGSKIKYVCQHSLLILGYTYSDGKYHVLTKESESIEIEDGVCEDKCVLLNKKFLEYVINKFRFDSDLLNDIKNSPNHARMNFYIPKFLHFSWVRDGEETKEKIFGILRRDWWDNYISPVGEWFMNIVKKIAPVLVACGIFWGSYKLAARTWKIISELFGLGDTEGLISSGASPSRKPKTNRKSRPPYKTQAFTDENYENKLDKIESNYAIVRAGNTYITIWGLKGTTALVPKHLSRVIKSCESIVLKKNNVTLTILVSNIIFNESKENDICTITFQRTAPLFKDCSIFLRSRNSENNLDEGLILGIDPLTMDIDEVDVKILHTVRNFEAADTKTGENFKTNDGVMYNYQKKGLCGSILCVHSVKPILAMHVAGETNLNQGVGVLIYADSFEVQGLVSGDIEDTGELTAFYGDDVQIEYVASVSKDQVPFIPKDTNIINSLISKKFEHECLTQPAILHISDTRYKFEKSPLWYGVCKNGKPTLDFNINLMDAAYMNLKYRLLNGRKIRSPKILSIQESIVGLPDIVVDDKYQMDEEIYYDCIALDTSAGFPYTSNSIKKEYGILGNSKKEWLTVTRREDQRVIKCKLHELVQQHIDKNTQMRRQGVLAPNIFQDCLKDERRKIAKVMSQGGTRLFSLSNIEGTISLRKWTLDLTSFLRYNRITNGIAVGINCDSMEWTILANKLLSVSNNIFTTDFSNFGAGLNIGVASYFSDLVKDYLSTGCTLDIEDKREIDCLIMELLASRHVVGNLIYGTFAGSPSGAAITVEINSFVHLMYINIVFKIIGYVILQPEGKYAKRYVDLHNYLKNIKISVKDFSYEAFVTNIYPCTYGDDGIFAVSDEYKEVFNALTINLVLKEHNIGITDASKSEKITKYTTLQNATFLKRTFRQDPDLPSSIWLAPIDWTTVEECVRWIHKKPLSPAAATRENCEASLHLAFAHGREIYDKWLDKINCMLEECCLHRIEISWDDIALKFFPEVVRF